MAVKTKKPKKVGLALGGGGAKGLAHIGVIRELERAGIEISYIAGTSMGALVGGWYAATGDIGALENLFLRVRKKDMLPVRKMVKKKDAGLFRDPMITAVIENYLAGKKFSDCKIPFSAIATNVKTGAEEILDSGDLEEAIRASTALPVVFRPVETKGKLLMDGGFVNPVPADVVRKMGAEYVIAVDVSSRWVDFSSDAVSIHNLPSLIPKALMVIEYQIGKRIVETADMALHPAVLMNSWHDFSEAREIIQAGEVEVKNHIREILDGSHTPEKPKKLGTKFVDFLFYQN